MSKFLQYRSENVLFQQGSTRKGEPANMVEMTIDSLCAYGLALDGYSLLQFDLGAGYHHMRC